MDVKTNHVDLTTLTAIVSDPDLNPAVAEMRRLDAAVLRAENLLYDLRIDAAKAREQALSEAHAVLHSDADIAHTYAIEAWVN